MLFVDVKGDNRWTNSVVLVCHTPLGSKGKTLLTELADDLSLFPLYPPLELRDTLDPFLFRGDVDPLLSPTK